MTKNSICAMVGDGQGFGEEICYIFFFRHEDDAKVFLPYTVPQPMEAHVKRLRHLEVDGIGRDTDGNFVVAEKWGWTLMVVMSSKIWRSLVVMRPAAKRLAYSAFSTNEQTTGIRVEWVEMG
jgi:hypothetical protein